MRDKNAPMSFTQSYKMLGLDAPADAPSLVNTALQLYATRRFAEAEAACRRALALMPAHAAALHLLGILHAERNEFASAVDYFRKAADASPRDANFRLQLGRALYQLGRLDEAVETFGEALALEPNLAQAHYWLGTVFKDLHRTTEADESFRTALILNPNLAQPDNQLGATLQDFGLYVSYRPVSDVVFKRHPEFKQLLSKFMHGFAENGGDLARLYAIIMNVKQVIAEGVAGDMAELGVYRGNSAAVLAHFARAHSRRLYLFDTFEGFDTRDLQGIDEKCAQDFSTTSVAEVERLIGADGVIYVKGYFPESAPPNIVEPFAFVHIDCDLYLPMKAGLEYFYPRLSPGGLLLLHDYSSGYFPGAEQAVNEFVSAIPENLVLLPDRSGSAVLRKSSAAVA
jgi:tetratricopeptide (TPR) repeat protein